MIRVWFWDQKVWSLLPYIFTIAFKYGSEQVRWMKDDSTFQWDDKTWSIVWPIQDLKKTCRWKWSMWNRLWRERIKKERTLPVNQKTLNFLSKTIMWFYVDLDLALCWQHEKWVCVVMFAFPSNLYDIVVILEVGSLGGG